MSIKSPDNLDNQTPLKENNVISLTENITYYIRNKGIDTNSGISKNKAWKTIKHAYSYIKKYVQTNGYKINLDIESGVYDLDELCQTALISSPAIISDSKLIIDKEEYQNLKDTAERINKIEAKLVDIDEIKEIISNKLEPNLNLIEKNKQDTTENKKLLTELEKLIELHKSEFTIMVKRADNTIKYSTKQNELLLEKRIEELKIELAKHNKVIDEKIKYLNHEIKNDQKNLKVDEANINYLIKTIEQLESKILENNDHIRKSRNENLLTAEDIIKIHKLHGDLHRKVNEYFNLNNKSITDICDTLQQHFLNINPHDINAEQIKYGQESNISDVITDLILNVRTPIKNHKIRLENNDNLNEILEDCAVCFDYQQGTLTIDLNELVTNNLKLINIPTVNKVIIKNGRIRNIKAIENIQTHYIFDNINFTGDSTEPTLLIFNSNRITLKDITIKGNDKYCIQVLNSFVELQGIINLSDVSVQHLIYSSLNSIIFAKNVVISPPVNRNKFNNLLVALSGSYQYWEDCSLNCETDINDTFAGNVFSNK